MLQEPQGDGNINSLAFSPDSASIAFGTDVGYVWMWNVATQTPRVTMSVANEADQVAFSPDGRQLAVPNWGGPTYLFATATGKLTRQLPGSTAHANAAAYSPNGEVLAVGDSQGDIRLWNPATGVEYQGLPGHTVSVQGLAFSRDGQLASAAQDGTSGSGA